MCYVKLSEVCDILNGYSFESSKYVEDGIRIIRIANVQKGYIDDTQPVYYPFNMPGIEKFMLKDGDLVMSLTGNVGRVAIIEKSFLPAALNQRVACLRPDESKMLVKYLYHFLNSDNFILACTTNSNGIAQKNMSTEWLKKYPIKICDICMQSNIVKILDNVQSLINKTNKVLDSLDLLVKSQFVEMFGDCNLFQKSSSWVALKNLGEIIGGATPRTNNLTYWDGSLPWITPDEIEDDSFVIVNSRRTITEDGRQSASLQVMPKGTVILSSRAPIGKIAIAGMDMYCNQGFKNIFCGHDLNPIYLYFLLKCNVPYLQSLGRGATFKEISKTIVENILIPCPSRNNQDSFSSFYKQVDKSKYIKLRRNGACYTA